MHRTHGCRPAGAVGSGPSLLYNAGMNSMRNLPSISANNGAATPERIAYLEARAAKARALERWENEGGSTPGPVSEPSSSRPITSPRPRT